MALVLVCGGNGYALVAAVVDGSRRCRHELGCCSDGGADLELFFAVVSRFRCCCCSGCVRVSGPVVMQG